MLTLPIKRKWFDMIVSGEKKEEYRDISEYWIKRIVNEKRRQGITNILDKGLQVCIRAGYRNDAPTALLTISKVDYGPGRPEWGAEPYGKYIRLHIESVKILKGAAENDAG